MNDIKIHQIYFKSQTSRERRTEHIHLHQCCWFIYLLCISDVNRWTWREAKSHFVSKARTGLEAKTTVFWYLREESPMVIWIQRKIHMDQDPIFICVCHNSQVQHHALCTWLHRIVTVHGGWVLFRFISVHLNISHKNTIKAFSKRCRMSFPNSVWISCFVFAGFIQLRTVWWTRSYIS